MWTDWLAAINWLIWGACGVLWIYNAFRWRKHMKMREKHTAMMLEFDHEMQAMVRKRFAEDAGRHVSH